MKKKTTLLLITVLLGMHLISFGQTDTINNTVDNSYSFDSIKEQLRLNVIKWNLTPLIWSYKNLNVSYERVTSSHGSFSVNAGYFVLPTMSLADSFNIKKNSKSFGFSVSGDKRYYFKKRNPDYAPDGLYWGIFGSVHYYEFESSFRVLDSEVASGDLILDGHLGILSAGVELGYQFVFKNNLTVDLIFMGPAISGYSGGLGISGDLQVDEDSEYIKAIYDMLVSKYPGVDKLLNDKSIKDNGAVFSISGGLRYMIQVGYRF